MSVRDGADISPLAALVERALDGPADRPAIEAHGRVVTLGELARRVRALGAHLLDAAGGPGERVAATMANGIAYVELYLACFRTGLAVMPLHPDLPDATVREASRAIRPAVVVHDDSGRRVARAVAEARPQRPAVLDASDLGDLPDPGPAPVPPPSPDSIAAVPLTSGTTGAPKGVVVTHRNWAAGIEALDAAFGPFLQDDVLLHVTPLSHTTAQMIVPALLAGAVQRILPAGDVVAATEMPGRGEATRLFVFSAMLDDLASAVAARGAAPRLRSVLYGGAPAPVPVIERAIDIMGPVLEQGFGQTETFPPTLALRKGDHVLPGPKGRSIRSSIGRPVGTCEVRLVGEDGEGEVPDGAPGTIAVMGPNVTPGYFGDEAATAAARRGRFFLTGDVAVRDECGFFHLLGRAADRIERRGGAIWPREIERAAEMHPGVLESAACVVNGALTLALVPRRGSAGPDMGAVWTFLAGRLRDREMPDRLVRMAELPRNVNRKLVRDALAAGLAAAAADGRAP